MENCERQPTPCDTRSTLINGSAQPRASENARATNLRRQMTKFLVASGTAFEAEPPSIDAPDLLPAEVAPALGRETKAVAPGPSLAPNRPALPTYVKRPVRFFCGCSRAVKDLGIGVENLVFDNCAGLGDVGLEKESAAVRLRPPEGQHFQVRR